MAVYCYTMQEVLHTPRGNIFREDSRVPPDNFSSTVLVVQAVCCIREAGVSKTTAIDVYQWLREVCSSRLLNHDILRLGGTGPVNTNIVQIDKSCFSHKPKVSTNNYHLWGQKLCP